MFGTMVAFIKRDFFIALSYRTRFLAQIGGVFLSTLLFFFMSRLVDGGISGHLAGYGGDYFAFVLIGVAFTDYLFVSVNSFADEIRQGQMLGTLEALLCSALSPVMILFCSSLYNFLFTTFRVVLYLLIGTLIFGMQIHLAHLGAFAVIMVLTIMSFWGIGLLSAALVVVFKQPSPLGWLMGPLAGLLGGVVYPIDVLPHWLQDMARLLPVTWSLDAMRLLLLNGMGWNNVLPHMVVLFVFSLVLQGTGMVCFRYALQVARKDGSLLHY